MRRKSFVFFLNRIFFLRSLFIVKMRFSIHCGYFAFVNLVFTSPYFLTVEQLQWLVPTLINDTCWSWAHWMSVQNEKTRLLTIINSTLLTYCITSVILKKEDESLSWKEHFIVWNGNGKSWVFWYWIKSFLHCTIFCERVELSTIEQRTIKMKLYSFMKFQI